MTESLESMYAEIGSLLAKKLSGNWKEARVVVEEIDTDVFDWHGEYESVDGQGPHQFTIGPEIARLVMLVRRDMLVPGKEAWRKATITIRSDGYFEMAYIY